MEPLQRPVSGASSKCLRLAIVSGLMLATAGGCGHRRSAMRPVYVGPATPVLSPSSSPCGTAANPCPSGEAGPAFSQPGDLPSVPMKSDNVTPAGATGEPNLLPATPGAGGAEVPPSPSGPNARRNTNLRPTAGMGRRDDGRDRVARHLDDPNELFLPPKADRPWRYIVLHHSDHATGSYAQIDKDHRQNLGTQGCGYHFVIGNGTESKDGTIEVARRWSDQKAGAHCRDATITDANDYGIGICLVGDLDKSPPTARQVEATKALIAYLRDRYSITADHVVAHSSVAQTPTTCPGKEFPIDLLSDTRGFASR